MKGENCESPEIKTEEKKETAGGPGCLVCSG
jgi:hypothetical protein